MTEEDQSTLLQVANEYAEATDTDVIIYAGSIDFPLDHVAVGCCPTDRRSNCLMILSTWGGDPHAAFRIARAIQQRYKKFTVFIPSYCKSAGTLLAVGAHELVMGEFGELGPLDIQVARKDELGEMSSGLVVNEALVSLQKRAIATFSATLKHLKEESSQITAKTAMQIAREMTVGLLAPIYSQIEPMHLGELARAMKITEHYGQRLSSASKNLKRDALQKLVAAYPSHYIDIDRLEAQTLFNNVREPLDAEATMARLMQEVLMVPSDDVKKSYVAPLSEQRETPDETTAHDRGHSAGAGAEDAEAPRSTGTRRGRGPNGRTVGRVNGREQHEPS